MERFSVNDVFTCEGLGLDRNGNPQPTFIDCIYVVYTQQTPLYIGMTEGFVVERLHWHLALRSRGERTLSDLGECIVANWPASLSWKIDVWKSDEVRSKFSPDGWEEFIRIDTRTAERFMIREYRPCLNSAGRERLVGPSLPAGVVRKRRPNQPPEPMVMSVTPPAAQELRQP